MGGFVRAVKVPSAAGETIQMPRLHTVASDRFRTLRSRVFAWASLRAGSRLAGVELDTCKQRYMNDHRVVMREAVVRGELTELVN
jgi:hypothetical protein